MCAVRKFTHNFEEKYGNFRKRKIEITKIVIFEIRYVGQTFGDNKQTDANYVHCVGHRPEPVSHGKVALLHTAPIY